jgi:acyl carrier protein
MTDATSANECIDEAIQSVLGVSPDEYDDSTTFGPNGLDVDSLQVVEMAETIEYELDVQIPDDKLEEIETVGDTKDVVRAAAN